MQIDSAVFYTLTVKSVNYSCLNLLGDHKYSLPKVYSESIFTHL